MVRKTTKILSTIIKIKSKVFLSVLGSLILIFLIPYSFLKYGVSVESFSNESVNIQGLHLKLDKKLVLKCDNIEIKENNDTQPLYVDPSWINGSVKIFDFLIEKLQIDKLTTNGHNFFIKYEDLNFFVDSEIFKSKGSILVANETLNGSFEFNLPNTQLILQVTSKIAGAEVEYKINTNGISNFEFLKKYLQLDENVAAWIYEKTSVDLLKIKDISGKFNINRLTDFTLRDLNSVVLVENLLLNYQSGKPPLHIKSLDVTKVDDLIVAKIKNVKDLQSQLSLSGNLSLNIDLSKIDFDGKVYFHDIVLDSNVSLENKILNIDLRSNEFKDPKVFKEFTQIPNAIEKWGFNRLSASSYQIDSLVAKIFLPHAILDKESLKVHATLKDITMDFNPKKAYPLVAKKVDLVFENGNMNFTLDKPFSNDVNLSGSKAVIYDLFSKSGLLLDLQSVSPLNETLVRVVESYGVSLPRELNLAQVDGKSDIKTKIDIPFTDDPINIFVTIKNKNSIIQIKDQNVSFENFDFLYENNEVHIKNTQAWVDQKKIDANISFYINSGQALVDASIEDINHTMAVKISNSTNLVKKISTGTIDVDKFSPTSELDICNLVLPYTVYFDKKIDTYLPTLMIRHTLDLKEGLHTINVDSFEMLYKFLDQNQTFPKYYGNLKATTKNFRDINISTNIAALDYPIFDGDEKIKSIHVDLFVDNLNHIRLTNQKYFDLFVDLQNSLKISGTVKNIGVQIAKQRDNAKPTKEQNKEPFVLEDLVLPYIDVAINDGYISFDGKTIDYQNIKLFANEKYFSIDGNLSDNYLMLRRDNKDIFTKIESKNSSILNKFIGSQLLDGKSITLTAIGDQTNQKVDAQIFDLSFIDEESNQSIYTINNGKIFATIDLNTTQVNLYSIEIDGDLADLSGHVVLNHLQNSIDGDVKAYLLTSYSDFISKIPLINYIFLGEDLKVDYGAKISGKLSKPKIETSILKESVLVPINIIARVLYLPIKGIETLSSSKSSTKLKQE